jgi:hypothetical protein
MDYTNYISAKIAKNLGRKCMVKKHFSEYKDDNGYSLFKNTPKQFNAAFLKLWVARSFINYTDCKKFMFF